MKLFKRYAFFLAVLAIYGVIFALWRTIGITSLKNIGFGLKEMLLVIPPVFILLGLLDEWVPREVMMRHMGNGSGVKGGVIAFLLGSLAAGPLYAAFPVAGVLMKKGASFTNIMIFIGAWSTTKVPMFLFEYSALGATFAVARLLIDIPVIIIIALVLGGVISPETRNTLYEKVSAMSEGK